MPQTDPATVRLADCPDDAVVDLRERGVYGVTIVDDAYRRGYSGDHHVRLLAPSLAALVARAEAGERLAEEVEHSLKVALRSMDAANGCADALAAYRKATEAAR